MADVAVARRTAGRATALLAAVCAGLAGCSSATDTSTPTGGGKTSRAGATVTVERRDITSVLALNAAVVAGPEFSLVAPVAGRFSPNRDASALVAAGTPVGWIEQPDKQRIPIAAPVDASLVAVTAVDRATVPAGMPVANLKATGFGLRAAVSDGALYRLQKIPGSAKAQIENGPGPFDCPILGGPTTGAGEQGSGVTVVCAPPKDLRLFPGLKGIVAVATGEARDVPVLPIEAVAGAAERGKVAVRTPAGGFEEREVRLGISDGSYVQILEGLTPGTVVRAQGPNLPNQRTR